MDNTQAHLRAISVCTGLGGLERGLKRAGIAIRPICYVEIEAFICANLVAGMEAGFLDEAPIFTDLKTFDWKPFRGMVDIVIGGYPCQPFSTAGTRSGSDDPRHLWPYIECGIRTVRPVCCFFENVSGHLTLGFEAVAKSLRDMGYAVEAGIFTAQEVGAPHLRARLFILGILADAKDSVRGLYERSGRSGETADDVVGAGEKLGNTPIITQREQADPAVAVSNGREIWKELSQSSEFAMPSRLGRDRWPARPGEPQYDWEEPRTASTVGRLPRALRSLWNRMRPDFAKMVGEKIWEETDARIQALVEPRFCGAADGYNFREDLLRALGNGVVEQTVELALQQLLREHFEPSATSANMTTLKPLTP